MAKRTKIAYNEDELTRNLKESAGNGVDAFFIEPDAPATSEPKPNRTVKPNARTEEPNGTTERTHADSVTPHEVANGRDRQSTQSHPEPVSLLDEMEHGVEDDARQTERYSFEIYTDQKDKILEIKYRYEKRTGKRLPKSRIVREALDAYCQQVLNTE